ncbi:MAG: HlyD family efflux transporter periplasmic adaptor subunit [Gammaproteobacteria bacterium]|nr:HlyD family efflux transporter periplasmic adaptor subunit [Gammaproteobacteria bacterium]
MTNDKSFGISPKFLDPQAWDSLNRADSFDTYARSWLVLLCASISGAERGVAVFREQETGRYAPAAFWPDEKTATKGLLKIAETALEANKGTWHPGEPGQLACPVRDKNGLQGVVALEARRLDAAYAPTAMRLLQWGMAGLLSAPQHAGANKEAPQEKALRPVLDCVALVLENKNFDQACTALVTHLASALDCRRVALGFVGSRRYCLKALSHSITFSEKTQLSRALEAAMAEAGEIGRCLVFPPQKDSRLYPAHEQLAGNHGGNAICTAPISDGESILGALVLERTQGFDEKTAHLCEAVSAMAGQVLGLKRDSEEGAIKRAAAQAKSWLSKILGPGHPLWKLNGLLLAGAAVFFTFAEGVFRVSADAHLEGAIQQAAVAPMDGFVTEAPFRAGDLVKAADLLFQLDDADLLLERAKWRNQRNQYQGKYRNALAQNDRAETRVLKAQLEQTKAQLDLVERQLARTRGTAPFEGIVVSGDLSQSLGAPVKRGDVLFEVAPLNDYRVVLKVDERDIAEIRKDQSGELVLASAADQVLPFRVVKVTPVSEAREGRNYFRVEADLQQVLPVLRPGMKGVGKVEAGQRRLLWIWTRGLADWLRVWLWSWWP